MERAIESRESFSSERTTFGSFYLCGSEFAISVAHVQEVVNQPERYTSLPLSPEYLVGLLNLRGAIIPVVDPRFLLKLTTSTDAVVERKIAILEKDGHAIGLLVDRTGEIFHAQADERHDFPNAGTDTFIGGVFKREEGRRLVHILNLAALFSLKDIPLHASQGRGAGGRGARVGKGLRKQCTSFLVGTTKCALGIGDIQEIIKVERVTDSALGGGHCIGVIDLRGSTVPIVDCAALLGYRECDTSPEATQGSRRIIVMRLGQELFGLLVDGVDSLLSYYEEDLKAFPTLASRQRDMFSGCISLEGQADVLLLNRDRIFTDSEILQITHGHSRLYRSEAGAGQAKKAAAGTRRTFITFQVAHPYAIGIDQIQEIIDFPKELMHPPGLAPFFKGVLNLRGELVSIVDARELYLNEARSDAGAGKVIIFSAGGEKFGLVVDSVEAIISVSDASKVKLPAILWQNSKGLAADVVEAIQSKDASGQEQNLLILTSQSIADRIARAAVS